MKQVIAILFSVILGIAIFGFILGGSGSGSIKDASGGAMQKQIEIMKTVP